MPGRPHDEPLLPFDSIASLVAAVTSVDEALREPAAQHQRLLTKPPGALGRLETLGEQLCCISGQVPPPVPRSPAIAIFAGDHGVVAEGVTPWPSEVTAQMIANFCSGGAAINVVARQIGASIVVVDVGVAADLAEHPALRSYNVARGTRNIRQEDAMTASQAVRALLAGAGVAAELIAAGGDLLVGGDMGIGNTTAAAAVIAQLVGLDAHQVTGRGTGIDDARLAHKTAVVNDALARVTDVTDPLDVVAKLGGLEIAALAGFYLGSAARRTPVVVDGVIALAAAGIAARLAPPASGFMIAGHRSTEPAATAMLERLGLEPLLELQLRLGEGSGAALAVPLIRSAAALMAEMATFADAGVTETKD